MKTLINCRNNFPSLQKATQKALIFHELTVEGIILTCHFDHLLYFPPNVLFNKG